MNSYQYKKTRIRETATYSGNVFIWEKTPTTSSSEHQPLLSHTVVEYPTMGTIWSVTPISFDISMHPVYLPVLWGFYFYIVCTIYKSLTLIVHVTLCYFDTANRCQSHTLSFQGIGK